MHIYYKIRLIKNIKRQKYLNKRKNHDIITNVTKPLYFKRSNERERETIWKIKSKMKKMQCRG